MSEDQAGSLLVVVSHDCDLQSAGEADVELFRATFIEKASGDCTYGKNPRTLHLPRAFDAIETLEISSKEQLKVPKKLLLADDPIERLNDQDRFQLASWLASRYKRAPFPDSFDGRLKNGRTVDSSRLGGRDIATVKKDRSLSKELVRLFAADGGPIEGIYVVLSGNEFVELEPEFSYELSVVVVAESRGGTQEPASLALASALADKIRGLFENVLWDGSIGQITLRICEPSTEKDFSLYQFRRMLRWHLDWLSGDEGIVES